MTNQQKKQFLQAYRFAEQESKRLQLEVERWMSKATAVTPCYGGTGGGSGDDKIQGAIDHILELQAELAEALEVQMRLRREVLEAIHTIGDPRLETMMKYRYINGWTLEKIAYETNYSYMQVCRLHGNALDKMML